MARMVQRWPTCLCLPARLGRLGRPRSGVRPGPVATDEQVCFSAPAHSEVCVASRGRILFPESCPDFCCGNCHKQYCCSDVLKKFVWNEEKCAVPEARWVPGGCRVGGLRLPPLTPRQEYT